MGASTGPWKLIVPHAPNEPDAKVELYDLSKDPEEKQNLAEMQPEIAARLRNAPGRLVEACSLGSRDRQCRVMTGRVSLVCPLAPFARYGFGGTSIISSPSWGR